MRKLLYFHASWCRPCKFVDNEFVKVIEQSYPNKIVRIDVQNEPVMAEKYRIEKLPTTIIIDGAKVIFRRIGGFDIKEVTKILDDKCSSQ